MSLDQHCDRCHSFFALPWLADDMLWDDVLSGWGQKYGILCPECFYAIAALEGISLLWKPEVLMRLS